MRDALAVAVGHADADLTRDVLRVGLSHAGLAVGRHDEVEQVAADRSLDERTGAPYYKVRVKVTPEGQKMLAQHKLDVRPGMPVELFVKTGERTPLNYLFKPIFDRAKSSMAEE